MTLAISIGKYGGFYVYWADAFRICLGWVAVTFYPVDLDTVLQKIGKPPAPALQSRK